MSSSANLFSSRVDLDDLGVLREELRVREVAAEDYQSIGVHHSGIPGSEAQETGHADVKSVIEFHILFTRRAWVTGACKRFSQGEQMDASPCTSCSSQDRHAFGAVQNCCRSRQRWFGRDDLRVVL